MQGTIQGYVLYMADDRKKEPLKVKQCDTNSRWAKITLRAFDGEYWLIPFDVQIYLNVHKADGTLATATCTKIDEHTVLAPITEQMTAVTGTQSGELYFLAQDGDIKSQTFPVVVYPMVMDQARIESSDDFQSLQDALRDVKTSTDAADIAAQYATEQGDQARDAARQAENAAGSIQVAVDAAAAAKTSEANSKISETAAVQAQQEATDYVEAQKAAFVGYSKRETDSKHANALTETATGEGGVTVEDAWTAPMLNLAMAGKSEQVQTTGAQLWPYGDVSGTTLKIVNVNISPGTYTLTADVTSSDTDMDQCLINNSAVDMKLGYLKRGVRQSLTFTANDMISIIGFYASINYDKSQGDTFEFKNIMLNVGDTALPWEPYTDGVLSPSPDYPQPIISTGTVSTGAQLLDINILEQGGINADTGVNGASSGFIRSEYIPVEPGNYVLSGEGIGPYLNYVLFYDQEKVIQGNSSIRLSNGKFTVPDGTAYIRIRFISKGGAAGTVTPSDIIALKPIVNAGDTPKPWEPYTGGKPAPSAEYPQTLEVGGTGAQLLNPALYSNLTAEGIKYTVDTQGLVTAYGTANNNSIFWLGEYKKRLEDGKTYCSSGGVSITIVEGGVEKYVVKFTFNKSTMTSIRPYLRIDNGTTIINKIYKPMLNVGETALPWEPYHSATAAITLTEPLRGIDDYRDRITCKDGVWGIERQVGVVDNQQWKLINIAADGVGHRFVYAVDEMINKLNCKVMCSKYTRRPKGSSFSAIGDYVATDEIRKIFIRTLNPDFETLAVFKESMADATTLYPLETPTWEPLPDATQQALNSLTTYTGTTHLTITAGGTTPTVTLDYVQDTHKVLEQHDIAARQYTDNQIAAIIAALPTATQAAIVDNQTTRLLQEV